MSELGSVGKIKRAMRLAKLAEVGMTLTYFDVIELLGELEGLEETVRILDTRDDDELITAYRIDNAELKRKVERLDAHNTYLSIIISELKMHAVNAGREVRDLKCKLAMADHDNSTLADESMAYKKRAEKAEAELSDMEVRDRIRYNEVMSRAFKAERMVERFIEAGERLSIHSRMVDDIDVWNALVAEWQAQ